MNKKLEVLRNVFMLINYETICMYYLYNHEMIADLNKLSLCHLIFFSQQH